MRRRRALPHRTRFREFIRWAQEDQCLLCPFGLSFGFHLHHLIPHRHGGPDDFLNLVALCPNHHLFVHDRLRDERRRALWTPKVPAALRVHNALPEEKARLLNKLVEPLRYSRVAPSLLTPELVRYAADDLVKEDLRLLRTINDARPRVYLITDIGQSMTEGKGIRIHLPSIEDRPLQDWINEQALAIQSAIPDSVFWDVVRAHALYNGILLPDEMPPGLTR